MENDVKWDFETEHWEALNTPNAKTEGAAASPLGRPQACCASNYTAGQAGPEVNAQVLSLSLTQELGLGASTLYCWNRTLHPRDLRGQGSNDSMASCMTGPQGGRNFWKVLTALFTHTHTYHSTVADDAIKHVCLRDEPCLAQGVPEI